MSGQPKIGPGRGNAGKGRPKGASNKLTRTVKEAIEAAFDKVGGADYLARMAVEQPTSFMTLLGKVLPTQINANVNDRRTVIMNFGIQDDAPEC